MRLAAQSQSTSPLRAAAFRRRQVGHFRQALSSPRARPVPFVEQHLDQANENTGLVRINVDDHICWCLSITPGRMMM
jgi:hypothetical protein